MRLITKVKKTTPMIIHNQIYSRNISMNATVWKNSTAEELKPWVNFFAD